MLRLSLSDLALRIKILKVNIGNSIEDALSRAMDPPSSLNIQRAVSILVEVRISRYCTRIGPTFYWPGESSDPKRGYHPHGTAAQQTANRRTPWKVPVDCGDHEVSGSGVDYRRSPQWEVTLLITFRVRRRGCDSEERIQSRLVCCSDTSYADF